MRWKVQLEGYEKGLKQLSESFDNNPRIFEEEGAHYIWSSTFEQLDQSIEVQDAGDKIIRIIRRLGEIDSLRVRELDASTVVEIQDDGSERKVVHASATATATTTTSARVSVEGEEPTPRAESTYEYTKLALSDDTVRELIELRDNGDHWVNLYRVYEYIQDNLESENNIVEQGWWTESEKDRFKQTANSSEAIGHEARHGDTRVPAPSNPMDHAQAKSLIENLINNWLRHRQESS
ncbi:hypothetical protein [Salinigranum salinum]|uniref:hypothetical protein n=1 Tax=Salinigranum salinum TaxID=1364937 RepID=UPI00126040C6|nr:hypothetical protein [Salinigranum salinum]